MEEFQMVEGKVPKFYRNIYPWKTLNYFQNVKRNFKLYLFVLKSFDINPNSFAMAIE